MAEGTTPEQNAESVRLTRPQREALRLLVEHEKRLGQPLDSGDAGTYSETWHDHFTVGIHWRVADALARRGLIVVDRADAMPGEPEDIYLTDTGRAHIDAQAVSDGQEAGGIVEVDRPLDPGQLDEIAVRWRERRSENQPFWFADMDDEERRDERWPWAPFIQLDTCCFRLGDVWFATKEECESFIQDMLDRTARKVASDG